jgi:putative aminopeptidase FrvX
MAVGDDRPVTTGSLVKPAGKLGIAVIGGCWEERLAGTRVDVAVGAGGSVGTAVGVSVAVEMAWG